MEYKVIVSGAVDQIGSVETGKLADFIVTNADYSEKRVFIGGKELWPRKNDPLRILHRTSKNGKIDKIPLV